MQVFMSCAVGVILALALGCVLVAFVGWYATGREVRRGADSTSVT